MSYEVEFDTGEVVEFKKMPTDQDIEDVVKKLGIKPKTARIPETKTATKKNTVGDVFTGIGKGATSTVIGLGQLALKGASLVPAFKQTAEQAVQTGEDIKNTQLKPENTAQMIGKTAEQIGEFLIPVGAEAKGLSLLEKALPGITKSSKISAGFAKLVAKSLSSGAEFGGKTVLQTGGNMGEAIDSALIGFITPPVFSAVGKVGKTITKALPERIYSTIFKTAEDDLLKYYQTAAKGQKTNPTLAKEALERGLKGNSKNMAVYSIKKLGELENKVQETVSQLKLTGKKISVDNKKGYINILQTVKDQFQNGFLSNRAKEAEVLIKKFSSSQGKEIDIDLALQAKRFIDRMRATSSFKLDPKLTPRQEEFKIAADTLRKKIADAGLKDLMNEERIFIEAIDNIVSNEAKRQNRNLLNLTDYILGGGGLATGLPGAGIGTAFALRALQQPFSITNIAQLLFKSGNAIEAITPFLKQIPKIISPINNTGK